MASAQLSARTELILKQFMVRNNKAAVDELFMKLSYAASFARDN
jgi:hypothetical protein